MDKVRLDLSRHCIETEIKRLYNSALSEYFRAKPHEHERLEQVIDLTQQALQGLDFNRLRSQHAPLAGHSDAHVVLVRSGKRLAILIEGRAIEP
ncbi:MAG: hypothetical protein C4519_26480 [Desulfobacteraceae bacterium]|nr:MAG: hypothetical protein C4519_26480 [Desulfobacteraceae bacterium]